MLARLLLAPVLALALVVPGAAGAGAPHAGTAGVGDPLYPRAGNGGYDVGHYDLSLDFGSRSGAIDADVRIRARATQRLTSFHLDLHGLRVDGVRVDGAAAAFHRRGDELVVRPAEPIAAGERFVARVRYHGVPSTIASIGGGVEGWVPTPDGAVVVNEPVGAMSVLPVNNHPTDKARWDVRIETRRGLVGVSNGLLVDRRVHGDRTTWHWRSSDPMASYLMTATVGAFRQYRARAADGTPVLTYVDPAYDGPAARRSVRTTVRVLDRLSEWFGPYPFESSGAIIDRVGLGYALEVQTRPVYDEIPSLGLQVHELAHQWFGDAVSPSTWQHIWLNEGFATYAEWLWGDETFPGHAERIFREFYARPGNDPIWSPPPARPGHARHLFGEPVYVRGAMALHVLRTRVGDDDFFAIARAWVRRHGGGDADTADLRRLAERISGEELGELFRDWVWSDGRPRGY